MGLSELYTFDQVVSYKPEWSLNYELGAHWRIADAALNVDAALFFMIVEISSLRCSPGNHYRQNDDQCRTHS